MTNTEKLQEAYAAFILAHDELGVQRPHTITYKSDGWRFVRYLFSNLVDLSCQDRVMHYNGLVIEMGLRPEHELPRR